MNVPSYLLAVTCVGARWLRWCITSDRSHSAAECGHRQKRAKLKGHQGNFLGPLIEAPLTVPPPWENYGYRENSLGFRSKHVAQSRRALSAVYTRRGSAIWQLLKAHCRSTQLSTLPGATGTNSGHKSNTQKANHGGNTTAATFPPFLFGPGAPHFPLPPPEGPLPIKSMPFWTNAFRPTAVQTATRARSTQQLPTFWGTVRGYLSIVFHARGRDIAICVGCSAAGCCLRGWLCSATVLWDILRVSDMASALYHI